MPFEIELILLKQVASYLAMPIFIVDPSGELLYYNEPAEALLGTRYDETGEMPIGVWSTVFQPVDREGKALPPESLPLAIALQERRPAHGELRITGLDGVERDLSVTAFPVVGQDNRYLGAVALFWEEGVREPPLLGDARVGPGGPS
jgi:PAS domain-containing protein